MKKINEWRSLIVVIIGIFFFSLASVFAWSRGWTEAPTTAEREEAYREKAFERGRNPDENFDLGSWNDSGAGLPDELNIFFGMIIFGLITVIFYGITTGLPTLFFYLWIFRDNLQEKVS